MKKLVFYFDFLSPYSYLAIKLWQRDQQFFAEQNVDVTLSPLSMFPIIKRWETKGPAEIPPKRDYLMRGAIRFAVKHSMPFIPPCKLPFISLPMLRIAQWALINKPMLAATLVQKLAELAWGSGLDPENESELHRIFLQSGFDEMDWVHLHSRDSRKQIQLQLRENQQAAIASECFGVPSWIFNGELFWGADAFVDLKYVIQGEDFLDHDQYRRYCDLVVNQAIETNPMQVQP